ncbi:MAG: amidohydrolase [Candidatus Zixiibacteriota bacterium]|nr:MAG: amidohydrolase [candidate division Zixibacteria bacterium]
MKLEDDILRPARELYPMQVAFRRHIHQNPELAFEEYETTKYIKAQLRCHKIKLQPLDLKTGVVAVINPHFKRAIAIRSELDALPIAERTDLPFQSKRPGIMHACGHDLHMAVVLGTMILLNRLKKQLPCAVKCIFQPAEEKPPGGASKLIRAGVLRNPRVEMIFALHVDPNVATGRIGLRDEATMASVLDFNIVIHGKGGHAARPHAAVDGIAVAAEVIESLQKIVSREIDPLNPALITIGTIEGGTARNIIADQVVLSGTARTLSGANAKKIPQLLKRTLDGICRARGARYTFDILARYPVLVNHKSANKILRECYCELFGKNKVEKTPQTMGGEDFSYYIASIPGAMFRLGVRNTGIGADKSWHTPDFMVDEEAIFYGTSLLSLAVLKCGEKF